MVSLRVVAVASLLMAGFGVYYTLSYLSVLYSEPFSEDTPYFRQAYYSMVSVCLVFYVLLAFFGVQFWRLRTERRFWFLGVLVVELVYFFSLGLLWRLGEEKIVMSIAAATGVANGGLVAQGVTLFPIWSAIIVVWAHSNNAFNSDAHKACAG